MLCPVNERRQQCLPCEGFYLPGCRLLTKFTVPEINSLLWHGPQIQLKSSWFFLWQTCQYCPSGRVLHGPSVVSINSPQLSKTWQFSPNSIFWYKAWPAREEAFNSVPASLLDSSYSQSIMGVFSTIFVTSNSREHLRTVTIACIIWGNLRNLSA